MALTAAQVAEQKKQVEELIADAGKLGFAKSLFFGRFRGDLLFPYPALPPDQQQKSDEAAAKVRAFADAHIDATKIDRESRIPDEVVRGLGDLGVLGMTIPVEYGGQGFNQQMYLRTMEVLGGHDASVAVFVNAHHSIGLRALLLFGTKEQQDRWLPGLLSGEKLAAFALTEREAGSDAANVQTTATPTEDGSAYVLNGLKHYITNGGIADVLTVMARTPDGKGGSKVTAFLVTPDLPGFEVVEARADKVGIRGTATGKIRFTDMRVPAENVLGKLGRGLQTALTVLNYGRVTFGATCTGQAKACIKAMTEHAKRRVQFQQPLAEFQLVRKKIAFAAAHTFAMEAATAQCAAFIDRGADDYMLETAILKVFSTEHLWTIVNDAFQIHGGAAYFTDLPLERILRDARINLIGEGANEVLTSFIALAGMRDRGESLRGVYEALGHPWRERSTLGTFAAGEASALFRFPVLPVRSPELEPNARLLGRLIHRFASAIEWALIRHRESILDRQLVQQPIAEAAMELFASLCVLSRRDAELRENADPHPPAPWEPAAATLFLTQSARRIRECLGRLHDNDNEAIIRTAGQVLVSPWA